MRAYDLGTPTLYSFNHTIILHVLRNLYAPDFPGAPYTFRVARTTSVNSNVGRVTVRDRDTVHPFNVWTLTATGDGAATSLFGLGNNGAIIVRSSLLNTADDEYL